MSGTAIDWEAEIVLCKRCGVELDTSTPGLLRFCFPCVRWILWAWQTANAKAEKANGADSTAPLARGSGTMDQPANYTKQDI